MSIVRQFLPVILGAVIGYFTNYIAIKMLFHPRKELRIGKCRVPFTPGVIPKNQNRIARAVGEAVSGQLFTKEDLLKNMKESGLKGQIVGKISSLLFETDSSFLQMLENRQELNSDEVIEKTSKVLVQSIVSSIEDADLEPQIAKIGEEALAGYLKNPMIAMFFGKEAQKNLYQKIAISIKAYALTDGETEFVPLLETKMKEFLSKPMKEQAENFDLRREMVEGFVGTLFDQFIEKRGEAITEQIDVSGIVRGKIEQMEVAELEALTMSVMKQELQAVINLGALIGALIGAVNLMF